jgi:hypothetical protein
MISEISVTPTGVEWESVAPHLDELVGQLDKKDRQAILLRFYQQKMFAEIGQLMGISEEAARKRTDRALERLRGMFARRGLSIVRPANLAVAMTQHLSPPSVPVLVSTTTEAALAGSPTVLADIIVRMTAWATIKTVMGLISIGITIAAITIVAARTGVPAMQAQITVSLPSPTAPPTTSPSTQPQTENLEAKVPGMVQLTQWDVILNQHGADIVSNLGFPVPTPSKIYQAILCGGDELRRSVDQAMANGGFENGSLRMAFAKEDDTFGQHRFSLVGGARHVGGDGIELRYRRVKGKQNVTMSGSDDNIDSIKRDGPLAMHITLNHAQMNFHLSEFDAARNVMVGKNLPTASIIYDGKLSTGEALAFLGRFMAPSGQPYYHLVVWETFNATDAQMESVSRQSDSAMWCQVGPALMRQWADESAAWTANANATVPADFIKQLDGGLAVQLSAISRPAKWPNCWWNADGAPIDGYDRYAVDWINGKGPQELSATNQLKLVVEAHGPPQEHERILPDPKYMHLPSGLSQQDFFDESSAFISDTAKLFEVGVPDGPWVEMGHVPFGQSLTNSDVTFSLDTPSVMSFTPFRVHVTHTGTSRDQIYLVAVEANGQEVAQDIRPKGILIADEPAEEYSSFQNIKPAQVKYFRLWSRKRQWVMFSKFVADPNPSPATITDTPAKTSSPPQTSRASSP